MANMTQEMYGAQGKVGNKVYYRANGKTVVREKVTPKNPKTTAQTLQRVILAQVGLTYKAFKDLCDHSFEGYTMGAQSMNRFKKLNCDYCRDRASEINQAGLSLAEFYNFQPIGSSKFVPGAAIIAQGSLPQIFVSLGQDELGLEVAKVAVAENTYAGVCSALRLKRGDQLTFVTVNKVNGNYAVEKARIILDPRNLDGSGASMSTTFVDAEGNVLMPSRRNSGNIYLNFDAEGGQLEFIAEPANGAVPVAAGIIASRKSGDDWLRSNTQLVISEENIGSDLCGLWTAVEQSYQAAEIVVENEYYLNNAGEGGSQGSGESSGGYTPSTDPQYSNTVGINGVNQTISGGSVNTTAPLNTVVINGSNLSEADVYAVKQGSADHINPTKTATTATFSTLNGQAGDRFDFYKGGTQWFSITVSAPGGDTPGSDQD